MQDHSGKTMAQKRIRKHDGTKAHRDWSELQIRPINIVIRVDPYNSLPKQYGRKKNEEKGTKVNRERRIGEWKKQNKMTLMSEIYLKSSKR